MQNLIIIDTLEGLNNLIQYITEHDVLTVDTETTGLDWDCKIIGISVCAEEHKSFYVILRAWDKDSQTLKVLETEPCVPQLLTSLLTHKLIMHNAVFDCRVINTNYNIDLMPQVWADTMILAHLMDENKPIGLKELSTSIFGESSKAEQNDLKVSIEANDGSVTKKNYELYKADSHIIGKYGAKDALLTFKLFWVLIEKLYDQNLQDFFFEESMPLLRGPTYDLNTTGLQIDMERLNALKSDLKAECAIQKASIMVDIHDRIKDKFPPFPNKKAFNLASNQHIAWLLFEKMGLPFGRLTESGKTMCNKLGLKIPYTLSAKRDFIDACKMSGVDNYWKYTCVDSEFMESIKHHARWIDTLLKYNKNNKILHTYVEGIGDRSRYGIIRPEFKQAGTTSGRYSSKNPNFQNLPRDDKRIKNCIIARKGHVFVGADYSQLEPRVFASVSQDPTLMSCFAKGEDFYSVVGAGMFGIKGLSLVKDAPGSFASKHKDLRQMAKAFALATPYGTSAGQQSQKLKKSREDCQDIIERYFEAYPKVELMMLLSHEQAKKDGVVFSLFGRPRRIPEAKEISQVYGNTSHAELPYAARNLLNLSMNHRVQSTAASIVNRASIAFYETVKQKGLEARLVLQVHDELVVECKSEHAAEISHILRQCMENTTKLPGVDLQAQPVVSLNLGDLK